MTLDFVFKTATGHDIGYWLDRGYLDMYSSYANGDDPGKGILTANWNHFPRQAASDSHRTAEGKAAQEFNWSRNPKGGARFQDILERMGYKLEWSDQTSRCDHCYGAVLEGPDYYGDSAHAAVLGDCSLVCESCIRKDFTEESTLTITVDLSKRLGPSASGKTIKIASSNGNVPLGHPSGATIGINVYTKEKG